jgi:hypothetical protein
VVVVVVMMMSSSVVTFGHSENAFDSRITPVGHLTLIHTCLAATLPFSDSAVSFVKVRVVD